MEKQEYFEIKLIKPTGQMERLNYKKATEKFQGNYAIVKAYSKELKYANHTWYGVINKNFETIIPFCLWKKIELFGNHFLLQESHYNSRTNSPQIVTWNVLIENDRTRCLGTIGSYQKINDHTVIAQDQNQLCYLYDVNTATAISNYFDEIGPFQEMNGQIVALAKRDLCLEWLFQDKKEFIGYIDQNGNIVSPIYNPIGNQYIDLDKDTFEEYYLNTIYQLSSQLFSNNQENILTNLKKQIRKPNLTKYFKKKEKNT